MAKKKVEKKPAYQRAEDWLNENGGIEGKSGKMAELFKIGEERYKFSRGQVKAAVLGYIDWLHRKEGTQQAEKKKKFFQCFLISLKNTYKWDVEADEKRGRQAGVSDFDRPSGKYEL